MQFKKIDNIELIDDGEVVYDIELEKNHYFSANGIISHNCRLRSDNDNKMFKEDLFYEIEDEEGNIRKISNKDTVKVKNLETGEIQNLYVSEIINNIQQYELL